VIWPDKERHASHYGPTHAVDILAFVEEQEIPRDYFETPSYYLAPVPGGESAYAQLREELHRSRKIGIAYVEIQARQHLAALVPQGQSLVLNTLRWASEAGSAAHFGLPESTLAMARELAMMEPMTTARVIPGVQDAPFPAAELDKYARRQNLAPDVVVEDPGSLLEDEDDETCDLYLAAVLRPRPHCTGGEARPQERSRRRHAGGWRRPRMRVRMR
jgi:DNA end-binding protein Ku